MFNNYIDFCKNEIVSSTCDLIKIPSVLSFSNDKNEPFGKNCADALNFALELGKSMGFRTKNVDGYCGFIECGEGEEMLGIIGHLDVVPADSSNWSFPPFNATVHNGKIYGRGAIDDKGPVIASLYAMKAVMDNVKLNKRVRLILGIDEENEWRCINYYKEHEELPTFGFSPDADFPCIYAEKSLLNVHLFEHYEHNSLINIDSIDYGNNAINVVPKFCNAVLSISNSISIDDCINNLNEIINNYSYKMTISKIDKLHFSLTSYGTSAHAAHPDLGINAISRLLVVLNDFFNLYKIDINIISVFNKYINTEFDGKSLCINCCDESGSLTLNVAKFYLKDNNFYISMNLRIPVNTSISKIQNSFNDFCSSLNLSVRYDGEKPSLYIPKDNKLVTVLCDIFNKNAHIKAEPIAIGGATYARAFKNCISFGANMPNSKDMCHQVDEFIDIDSLILSCKIYANAIYELCK